MKRILKALAITLGALLLLLAMAGAWYIHSKQPQRDGALSLAALTAPVSVQPGKMLNTISCKFMIFPLP